MRTPRLHVVTDDAVLARRGFAAVADALLQRLGDRAALHLRGATTSARRLHALAARLVPVARRAGAWLVVNDRIDVALAVRAGGVQLGRRSLPVQAARALVGRGCGIGYSAHGAEEAASAVRNGADLVLLGTIWPTPSHPGREGAGLDLVRATRAAVDVPVIAIGGVARERVREALGAGAYGVAVIRGVWAAADPVRAAVEFAQQLEGAVHGN